MTRDSHPTQPHTDFYTVIHKALRKRLFEAVILAGITDYVDSGARATLAHTVREVVTMLRDHAVHEDEFLHPIIAEVLPDVACSLTTDHEEHARGLDEVEEAFEVALAERSGASAHLAYRTLARFTAHFLAHIEREEADQPRLWKLAGEARLASGMEAFKRSRTLEQSLTGWSNMLPAMSAAERTGWLRGLSSAAPDTVVTAALRVAEQVLDAGAWEALRSSLDPAIVVRFRPRDTGVPARHHVPPV